MKGLEKLREATAEFLQKQGIAAVTAWEDVPRRRREIPVVTVSLRGCEGGPAGLKDYLGERYDTTTGQWEELYGKRARLTLGLDIYAPEELGESGCAATFSRLGETLANGGPEGLTVQELSCGETEYDTVQRLFRCRVQAVCQVYLYAVSAENGVYRDFIVRGIKE